MKYYEDLVPIFPDPETWTFDHVLRHHAAQRPDAICLDLPEEGRTWTYAQALDSSERGTAVWVLSPDGSRAFLRDVVPGRAERAGWVEVAQGLHPGDVLVLRPDSDLRDGGRVRIVGEEEAR